jgi:hypothetical protein
VYDLFAWLEGSGLGRLMRHTGPWTYAIVNLSHVLGVASLFGSVLVLDLRLLGAWRRVPLGPLADAVVPVAATGLALAATTGVALFATKTTEYFGNPFLLIKFPAIALALINVLAFRRSEAWQARAVRELSRREERQLAVMGGMSLACWLTAIAAGRLIAYW